MIKTKWNKHRMNWMEDLVISVKMVQWSNCIYIKCIQYTWCEMALSKKKWYFSCNVTYLSFARISLYLFSTEHSNKIINDQIKTLWTFILLMVINKNVLPSLICQEPSNNHDFLSFVSCETSFSLARDKILCTLDSLECNSNLENHISSPDYHLHCLMRLNFTYIHLLDWSEYVTWVNKFF